MKVAPFLVVYATVPALLLGIWFGGWASLLVPLVAFLLIPVADQWLGHNLENAEGERRRVFDLPLFAWVPLQLGFLVWAGMQASQRSGWDFVGLAVSVGLFSGGVGITIAHELMHRKGWFERAMAEVLMLSVTYPHFCIEHVYGHHKHVATPHDPATSHKG